VDGKIGVNLPINSDNYWLVSRRSRCSQLRDSFFKITHIQTVINLNGHFLKFRASSLQILETINGLSAKLLRQLGMPFRNNPSHAIKNFTKWVSAGKAEPPSLRHFDHSFFLHGKLLSRSG